MIKNCLPVVLAGLTLLGLGGCDSISEPGTKPAGSMGSRVAVRPNPFDVITKGMTAAEVRALVGEPREIKADKTGGTDDEIWRYQIKVDEVVRRVPIGTRDVPAVNPVTGQSIIIQEPVMGDEFTTLYQDIDMLMIGDRLIEIKRRPRVERHIVN